MRRTPGIVAVISVGLAIVSYAGMSAALGEQTPPDDQHHRTTEADTGSRQQRAERTGSTEPNVHGQGESLVLVVGGIYPTRTEAESAANDGSHGALQGYYVASVDDFRVTAAYADVRPAVAVVPCTDSGIASSKEALPELEQVSVAQLEMQCDELGEAREHHHLELVRDARLERVPFEAASTSAQRLTPPRSCATGSRCLGTTIKTLDQAGGLSTDHWMTVSAFRTLAGAEEFITWYRSANDSEPAMVLQVVRHRGRSAIGLGQESHPDGSGPALGPLPRQEALQQ